MVKLKLRKVGGSTVLAIPPAFLASLEVGEGSEVMVELEQGAVKIKPMQKKLTLDELLAKCDFSIPMDEETIQWLNDPPVGNELL